MKSWHVHRTPKICDWILYLNLNYCWLSVWEGGLFFPINSKHNSVFTGWGSAGSQWQFSPVWTTFSGTQNLPDQDINAADEDQTHSEKLWCLLAHPWLSLFVCLSVSQPTWMQVSQQQNCNRKQSLQAQNNYWEASVMFMARAARTVHSLLLKSFEVCFSKKSPFSI